MSVERFDHDMYDMCADTMGDYVRYTDYQRDCIKGQCGVCKKGLRMSMASRREGHSVFRCPLCTELQTEYNYCDEWEGR